jgi:hypothetical protein
MILGWELAVKGRAPSGQHRSLLRRDGKPFGGSLRQRGVCATGPSYVGKQLTWRTTLCPHRYPHLMRSFRSLALPVLFLSASAQSWHDTGHMVVADIAGRSLTGKARQEIDRLLQVGGSPKTNDLITAACWADDTKNGTSGLWHYINYHFRPDGQPSENIPLAENVVWAIRKFSETIQNAKAPDAEKADALRYLLHFVGDIHQPLHNVARDSTAAPAGDRGGNDFKLLAPEGLRPAPRNLHFLWDMGAGLFVSIERPLTPESRSVIRQLASQAMGTHPPQSFKKELQKADPEEWAREGLDLALKKVYLLEENKVPSAQYLQMCQTESRRLVALAGYRLGALLNRALSKPQ